MGVSGEDDGGEGCPLCIVQVRREDRIKLAQAAARGKRRPPLIDLGKVDTQMALVRRHVTSYVMFSKTLYT